MLTREPARHTINDFDAHSFESDIDFQSGEYPLENAPQILLQNGRTCIPQHFLTYTHSCETIEALLADIDYDPRYLLFVSEDGSVPYIQVGIVGYDNYKHATKQKSQKIVFGRKWRVEPNLPTSEIIQTAFLAIKKAREHEIRELFKIKWADFSATPFNNHHDLPLLAKNKDLIETVSPAQQSLEHCLSSIRYDGGRFLLLNQAQRPNGDWLIDIEYCTKAESVSMTLILPDLTDNTILYSLMEKMIEMSDRHVDETFTYRGFARFSRNINVSAIGEISSRTRRHDPSVNCVNASFDANLAQEQYDTDASRVPHLTHSEYSNSLRERLKSFNIQTGFQPK